MTFKVQIEFRCWHFNWTDGRIGTIMNCIPFYWGGDVVAGKEYSL